MAEKKENNDISKLTFEQAIKKLTDIVSKIEQGQISLEQSLAQYEQGMELIKHCRAILQKAEKKIEEIAKQEKEK
jgi:exodeoxyribonuclease VII small subunit